MDSRDFWTTASRSHEEDLIAVCREIAAGTAVSHDCRRLIAPDLPEALRFARAGQHFVVFVEDAEQVTIIDFLHGRSDLPRRLANIRSLKNDKDF
ncbi:type II toxin-antitoxin system RelE/ParE family toxin [Pannonibacter sp.]|uniref:type II toxin-antitoxin system RelE/ParE family toxin n=1 Tax=Pannonibacter sp. TaxID=1906786 RepID=UPI003F71B7C6